MLKDVEMKKGQIKNLVDGFIESQIIPMANSKNYTVYGVMSFHLEYSLGMSAKRKNRLSHFRIF